MCLWEKEIDRGGERENKEIYRGRDRGWERKRMLYTYLQTCLGVYSIVLRETGIGH